jgi:hypothetical protein
MCCGSQGLATDHYVCCRGWVELQLLYIVTGSCSLVCWLIAAWIELVKEESRASWFLAFVLSEMAVTVGASSLGVGWFGGPQGGAIDSDRLSCRCCGVPGVPYQPAAAARVWGGAGCASRRLYLHSWSDGDAAPELLLRGCLCID